MNGPRASVSLRCLRLAAALCLWCAAQPMATGRATPDADQSDDANPVDYSKLAAHLQKLPELHAAAYPSSERVLLGRPFSLILVVTAESQGGVPANIHAELPSSIRSLGPAFELGSRFKDKRSLVDGSSILEIEVEITAWRVGALAIPPIPIEIPWRGRLHTIYTEPARVEVAGLVIDDNASLRDATTPVPVMRRGDLRIHELVWRAVTAGVAAIDIGVAFSLVAFVLLGLLVWRALRRRQTRPILVQPAPAHSPDTIALQALHGLVDSDTLDHDPTLALQTMSEIMRTYLGARFEFETRDTTTRELMANLRAEAERHPFTVGAPGQAIGHILEHDIEPWLTTCDLVKFADARATTEDAVRAYADALAIVAKTTPALADSESTPNSEPRG